MNPTRSLARSALAAALFTCMVGAASPAEPDCPAGYFYFGAHTDSAWSTAAVRETTVASGSPTFCGSSHGAYDLRAGTLSVEYTPCLGGEHATAGMEDEYVITGLPPELGITFGAELETHATAYDACSSSGCGVHLQAVLREGSTNTSQLSEFVHYGEETMHGLVSLTIDARAGEPFRMAVALSAHFETAAGYPSFASLSGVLRFTRLPPGAQVTSCHGYVGPFVPTRAATWGQVKATYR